MKDELGSLRSARASRRSGWAEGRNIQIDLRWAADDAELMQRFAKELVALQPDIILTQNTPSTAAMLRQTRSIPIVFGLVSDPVGSGFVASFSRPGGNVTGFINFEGSVGGKWLELLKETAPRTNRVAFLFNPTTAPFADLLSRLVQSCGPDPRRGGDHRTCSRRVPARIRCCRSGTRTEWRRDRDAGDLPKRSSHARSYRWLPASICLPSTHFAFLLNSAACCPTELNR